MRKRLRPQEIRTKDMEIVDEVCRVLKVRCKSDLYALKILRLARIVATENFSLATQMILGDPHSF